MIDTKPTNEEDVFLLALELADASVKPLVMQSALELNVFEIISKAGEGAQLSAKEIASHLPTKNPEADGMLDRMLHLLAIHSVLTCSSVMKKNGSVERHYGLAPVCKYFLPDGAGASFAPLQQWANHSDNIKCWYQLKDAVLGGGITFERVHGMPFFNYIEKTPEFSELFNRAMFVHTTLSMKRVLEVYKGFENMKQVIDVGGGVGTLSNIIVCLTHVGGDIFSGIPKGENIFMKNILHDWSDELSLKILRKCHEALPDNGKVVVVEILLTTGTETEKVARGTAEIDVSMMMQCPGGKERSFNEFENLAKEAGFASSELVCVVCGYGVMEFQKTKSN